MNFGGPFFRFWAVLRKEFIQMRRDRLTFAMMIGVPILQLVIFGYAINANPKTLPTAVVAGESTTFTRTILAAMENTGYFDITGAVSAAEADAMVARGDVLFVVTIPTGFSRQLLRGERPLLLVEADATDPAATSNALSALNLVVQTALARDLSGPLANLNAGPPPFELRIHRRYNEEGITQYNIVPGLIGVVLTMTMVIMTSLAMTRERERGTMENLLAMPVRPSEVMFGKIIPYVFVGYVQVLIIILIARYLFAVPMIGSLWLLSGVLVVFIAANLAMGFTFSTVAENQLQAIQMSIFFFLPSILLSGFMFPFRGMPQWAQWIGEVLPLTHFLRIVRGIMLKGNEARDIWPEVWPLLAFLVVVMSVAMLRYRRTLD
ncbi:MAG: ABC transporter permease [Proteobacteria bacterium]|nr:ABC transporter permease [Pseudomonadota bacterium]MDA1132106.1 ABC transporter permease [Pseudomonadota bacterium]